MNEKIFTIQLFYSFFDIFPGMRMRKTRQSEHIKCEIHYFGKSMS